MVFGDCARMREVLDPSPATIERRNPALVRGSAPHVIRRTLRDQGEAHVKTLSPS